MPTLHLVLMQQRKMMFQSLPHNTNWEPFPMSALFDIVSNQPYGYQVLRCISVKRRQEIEMILSYINFSMVWLCLQLMMKLLVLLHKQVCMRKIIMHFRTSITIITNVTTPTLGLQLGVECKGT
jgi:hypothetical protein